MLPTARLLTRAPPHLLSTAQLSNAQLSALLQSAAAFKAQVRGAAVPPEPSPSFKWEGLAPGLGLGGVQKTLEGKTIAVLFSKRSTRTRVAAETSAQLLGGHPLFLSPSDIQLGVNESLLDTAKVVSSMVDGIFARVGDHAEVELLAQHSTVPVINALSALYHPTQTLADLLTLSEHLHTSFASDAPLAGLTVAWVGDANNILYDMMVSFPRLGATLQIATPRGYEIDAVVWEEVERQGEAVKSRIVKTEVPEEAVKGADLVLTDTWISMGQEAEKAQRLKDFAGFQVTEALAKRGGAKPHWKFMHCLPRKAEEVDDDVFYGPRSLVFPEAENRKWTIMAAFDSIIGRWKI